MGLAIKTSEKASIRHLGSHHISWRGICYCCSLEWTIINSEAIYLTSCWMGVFLYRLHDNWLYHNFADISPSKYIKVAGKFQVTEWLTSMFLWYISFRASTQSTGKFIVTKHFSKNSIKYNKSQRNDNNNNQTDQHYSI